MEYITNHEKTVRDVIENILPYCSQMHFLVGYFYFSGFQEIYKEIRLEQKMRVLVGLDAEAKIGEFIEMAIYKEKEENLSSEDRKNKFFHNVTNILSTSETLDNKETKEAFDLFINKVKNGTLEVRKTKNPCHAKLYLMEMAPEHNHNEELLGTTILGSSNFSFNGLRNNFEINIKENDNDFFKTGKGIFQKLWDEADILVNTDNYQELETKLVKRVWTGNNDYTPFEIYIRVLKEYFSVKDIKGFQSPSKILGSSFSDLKYQTDSIKKALEIISDHQGVIISDVVGLGKSVIAATVAANLGLPVIVITPRHLKKQWEEYTDNLNLKHKIFTNGKIDAALEYINNTPDQERLIIIDEAHSFRNYKIQRYSDLETLCRGNKVILISATPFNNKPEDIFALIRLFQIPNKSTLRNVSNISKKFKELQKEYDEVKDGDEQAKRKIAKKITNIISPILIRRNRKDLLLSAEYKKDLEIQQISFPEIEEPQNAEYPLGDLSGLYINSLEQITDEKKGFKGSRYKPTTYVKDEYKAKVLNKLGMYSETQTNLAKFMRRLLVRRFESSVAAFKKTVDNILDSYKSILSFYEKNGLVIISKKGDLSIFDDMDLTDYMDTSDYDDIKTDLFDNQEDLFSFNVSGLTAEKEREFADKGIYFIKKEYMKDEFVLEMNHDINFLTELQEKWRDITAKQDPKLQGFENILKEQLKKDSKRKIIVFSEFADTVNYVFEHLQNSPNLRLIRYTSDMSAGYKDTIRMNFDAGLPESKQKNDFDALIATDAMSEGVNLNRAGTVFNYDIPYNPTRVIQRVGRINRVNKKMFEKLYIYNYFPTTIGEDEVGIKKIATTKMKMIGLILGEDTKYLTSEEETGRSQIRLKLPQDEEASWDTQHRVILEDIRLNHPEIYKRAMSIVPKARLLRETKENTGVILFGKKGNNCVFNYYNNLTKEIEPIMDEQALKYFSATQDEPFKSITDNFYDMYSTAKSSLFVGMNPGNNDNGGRIKNEAWGSLRYLLTLHQEEEYFKKIEKVFKLDALANIKLRMITQASKNIKKDINTVKENINMLKQYIPPSYLDKILQQEIAIQTQKGIIILAEEFTSNKQGETLL